MTEQEWSAATTPEKMLRLSHGLASRRKVRLFACACCRRLWDAVPDGQPRRAVEAAELFADGLASGAELGVAFSREDLKKWDGDASPAAFAAFAAYWTAWPVVDMRRVFQTTRTACRGVRGAKAEQAAQAALLRCVLGNPFRPVEAGPWITPAAVTVAQDCYDRRDFAALPLLADLLEEAGCPEQSVLDHCRRQGEHARGCWVVDLVLGKS